jgi:ABC-type branched-subunit amino acid transport system ATPase component
MAESHHTHTDHFERADVVLQVADLRAGYGRVPVLHGVNLQIHEGEAVGIVGHNGMGKTTLCNALTGLVSAQGSVRLAGEEILGKSPHEITRRGMAYVPQGRRVWPSLSVDETLRLVAPQRSDVDRVYAMFPRLAERSEQAAGTLSGGEQQMVAIGRGLASMPQLLMLDEPSMGLAPAVADLIFECIQRIHKEQGISVLLVEQRVGEALESCDRGYVLESGHLVMSGTHQELMQDSRIKKSYLGL